MPLYVLYICMHTYTCMYLHSTRILIHTHAQNQISAMIPAPCLPSKHLFSMSCHQYLLVFTQYSTDIAMHTHSCTIVQSECSVGADVARSQMPTVLWCSPILSAKVQLVFLVYAYLEVICVRDTVITPDHEVHVVQNYSPSHIELHI